MSDFYQWWDQLYAGMAHEHDMICEAGDNKTPCAFSDRDEHIRAAYMLPHLKTLVRDSGIYNNEEAN